MEPWSLSVLTQNGNCLKVNLMSHSEPACLQVNIYMWVPANAAETSLSSVITGHILPCIQYRFH